jgi:hypothetical protein
MKPEGLLLYSEQEALDSVLTEETEPFKTITFCCSIINFTLSLLNVKSTNSTL